MATPQQQPISFLGSYERVEEVDAIVAEAECGYFMSAALLVDQVLRDARIYSVLMTRILGLLGKDLDIEPEKGPRSGEGRGRKIADDIEMLWDSMFPYAALVELIVWGLMLGVGLARVDEDSDPWKLEVWHPWALEFDQNRRAWFVTMNVDGGSRKVRIDPDGNGGFVDELGTRWVLFAPFGLENAGRRGYLRNLHHTFLDRNYAHRDRARYSEIFGQAMRVVTAPLNSTPEERSDAKKKVLAAGTEPAVVLQGGPEGEGWKVSLVEASGRSTELFESEIEQLNKEIATLFLGQSQSTDGVGGLGSQEKAGESVRLDVMRADNEVVNETLRTQFLVPYCAKKYGNGEMAPWICREIEPPEDLKSRAEQFKTLMDGIAVAKLNGVPIDVRMLLEQHDMPMVDEAKQAAMDAQAKAAQQQQPAAPTNGTSQQAPAAQNGVQQ